MIRLTVDEQDGRKWVSLAKHNAEGAVSLSYSWRPGEKKVSVSRDYHYANPVDLDRFTPVSNCLHLSGPGYCDGITHGWYSVLADGMPSQKLRKEIEGISL